MIRYFLIIYALKFNKILLVNAKKWKMENKSFIFLMYLLHVTNYVFGSIALGYLKNNLHRIGI